MKRQCWVQLSRWWQYATPIHTVHSIFDGSIQITINRLLPLCAGRKMTTSFEKAWEAPRAISNFSAIQCPSIVTQSMRMLFFATCRCYSPSCSEAFAWNNWFGDLFAITLYPVSTVGLRMAKNGNEVGNIVILSVCAWPSSLTYRNVLYLYGLFVLCVRGTIREWLFHWRIFRGSRTEFTIINKAVRRLNHSKVCFPHLFVNGRFLHPPWARRRRILLGTSNNKYHTLPLLPLNSQISLRNL